MPAIVTGLPETPSSPDLFLPYDVPTVKDLSARFCHEFIIQDRSGGPSPRCRGVTAISPRFSRALMTYNGLYMACANPGHRVPRPSRL